MVRTINEALKLTDSELQKITDGEIKRMGYGIKFFDFRAAGITPTARDQQVLEYLESRLKAVESARVARVVVPVMVQQCNCGHSVAKGSVMMASLGTSCLDCYDSMSD